MTKETGSKKLILNILRAASVFVFAITLILFLCVVIGGNNWNVNFVCKLPLEVPNILLFLITIPLFAIPVVINLLMTGRKDNDDASKAEKNAGKKEFIIVCAALFLVYALWYLINVKISKKIMFSTGWDPSCVQGTAYKLFKGEKIGDDLYYSIYPNNIPMAWVLYKTFGFIKKFRGYPYYSEFFWIQILCALESFTGMVLGIAAYVSTKKILAPLVSAGLFIALIGTSPWSIIPYTDAFTILFPILGLCFYFIYLEMKKSVKYVLFFAACFFLAIGSLLKITVMIVLIGIVISELLRIIIFKKESLKRTLIVLALALSVIPLYFGAKAVMYKDTGAEITENLSVSWQHYFYMGLIEETTGSYNSEAYALIGQYQYSPGAERNKKELELAGDFIKERGPVKSVFFYLKKLVMTYNDGTFTWRGEGGVKFSDYPDISSEKFRDALRSFIWNGGEHELLFNAYSQCVWLLILLGVMVSTALFSLRLFKEDEVDFKSFTAVLSIVGITLFIMLFEARARYLYNFVPIFILLCTNSMFQIERKKK